jgi:low temperature requirement protein LtrA
MAADNERGALFRPFVPKQHSRVTYAELRFDLVFVFAVTQISHTLLGRFTPLGALQTTVLFLGVWWVWAYTAWITNYELAQSRARSGSSPAVPDDARRARALDLDSQGL